jgi:Fe2+ or Zn2+ uptake regulation protein
LTIDAVFEALGERRCDRVTVYRLLDALENCGMVRRQFRHDGARMFELMPTQAHFWISSRADNLWERLPEANAAQIRSALAQVEKTLRAAGFRDPVPMIQFFVDR